MLNAWRSPWSCPFPQQAGLRAVRSRVNDMGRRLWRSGHGRERLSVRRPHVGAAGRGGWWSHGTPWRGVACAGLWLTSDGLWLCCFAMNGGDGGELHRSSCGTCPAFGCHAATAVDDGTALPLRATAVNVAASAFGVVTFPDWRGGGGALPRHTSRRPRRCHRVGGRGGGGVRAGRRRRLPAGVLAAPTAAAAGGRARVRDGGGGGVRTDGGGARRRAVTPVNTVWVGPTAAGVAAALGPHLHRVPRYAGLGAAEREVLRLP